MTNAKIENINGRPAITVNGEVYPPMMATIRTTQGQHRRIIDGDYYRELGKTGIKIYFVICDTEWAIEDAFDKFCKEAEILVKEVPDAYIVLRVGMHPSPKWCEENPDETLCYSDGKKKPIELNTESYIDDFPAMYSLASQKWRETAGDYLMKLFDKLEKLPYFDRIIGCFFAAGGTSEWYYISPMHYTSKSIYCDTGGFCKAGNVDYEDVYADLSPAFRKEFTKYLKEKYKTEENLKKAWNDESATFDNPRIADCDKRYFIHGVDHDIDYPCRMLPASPKPEPPTNGTNIGQFIDLTKNMDVYDFFRALHKATADSVIYFGEIIKKRYNGNMLTGSFYGSAACEKVFDFSQIGYVYHILKSDVIDFLASPGVYENRQPGGFVGQRQCFDSFALNNRIFVCEDDTRTHHENAFYQNTMEMYDLEDTYNVLKREFARNLTTDVQAWWFDQHIGGGRYKDEDVYKLFTLQQKIAKECYQKDRTKNSEIAFIYDEESYHVVSEETTHQMVELFRNYEIDLIGAPSDRYFHNDMENLNMPDYKLYVFVNTMYLTDKEREVIKNKLKKNNATALFMYASGCINPDNTEIFGAHNISDFTGINTVMNDEVVRGKFKFLKDNDMFCEGLDKYDIYGDFKRKMWANASGDMTRIKTSRVHMYPEFYADDEDAKTCAYILENKHPALSVKECDGFTSIYCASKYLSSDVVRNIARFAGCHIYCDSDDVLYANKHYVAIHGTKSGTKTIKLPKKCKATEVYENKVYCEDGDTIIFNLNKGETKMFEII